MNPVQESTPLRMAPVMPSRRGLLLRVGGSLAVALLILGVFVLPAEFHRDPTGLGRITGLMALSQPAPADAPANTGLAAAAAAGAPARSYKIPFRTDEVNIPMRPDGELEYKVKMQPGGTLVYSLAASKGTVYYDFHGERPEDPDHAQSYGTGIAPALHGSLIAPFAGIHGWFLQNQEGEPIVVHLRMAGFYELRDVSEPKE